MCVGAGKANRENLPNTTLGVPFYPGRTLSQGSRLQGEDPALSRVSWYLQRTTSRRDNRNPNLYCISCKTGNVSLWLKEYRDAQYGTLRKLTQWLNFWSLMVSNILYGSYIMNMQSTRAQKRLFHWSKRDFFLAYLKYRHLQLVCSMSELCSTQGCYC